MNILITLLLIQDVYLTHDEAMKFAFGSLQHSEKQIVLSTDELTLLKNKLKRNDIDPSFTIYHSNKDKLALIINEVGKYKDITFIVALDSKLTVTDVSIMTYREAIGDEVRKQWWLKQFKGKTGSNTIKRTSDIINLAGATLSVDAVCKGVRKAIALAEISLPKLQNRESEIITKSFYVMGSLLEVKIQSNNRDQSLKYIEESYEIAKRLDKILSVYKEESEISNVNKNAGVNSITVSDETLFLIQESLKISRLTDGAFDITIFPATKAWGFIDKKFRLPDEKELYKLQELIDYSSVVINTVDKTVTLKKAGMGIDTGGNGKGLCVKMIADYLSKLSIERAFVNFRSSQYGLVKDSGPAWTVLVEDPSHDTVSTRTLYLKNEAISVSGSYENFFEANGDKYCHIIDPKTCKPSKGVTQITLVGIDPFELDMLSTAMIVMGTDKALKFAKNNHLKGFLVDDKLTVYNFGQAK